MKIFGYFNIVLRISYIRIRILSFDQTNIFEYLIRNFEISEYIPIFDSLIFQNWIYSNIRFVSFSLFKYLSMIIWNWIDLVWVTRSPKIDDIIYIDSVSSQPTRRVAWWPGPWEDVRDDSLLTRTPITGTGAVHISEVCTLICFGFWNIRFCL